MYLYKISKNFIYFTLLYTILFSNSSLFYIFANESNHSQFQYNNSQKSIHFNNNPTVYDHLNLTAESAVLIDAKTGIVLYDKNMNAKSYPASTTKILTSILLLENTKPTDILTHSHNSIFNIGPGSSHIGMRENEEITMDQALHGILLASANEVCMAVAEHISGSVENFVELMNERAKKIGAKNTQFANPHGFYDENHYTTSYDMALLMKDAIKNEEFIKVISTTRYTIPPTNIINQERILNNTNKLIYPLSPFYYKYSIGSKTGYTSESGNTLVSYAKKDDIDLIAAVMKDDGTKVYNDTKSLFEYGFSLYEGKKIFNKSDYEQTCPVIQRFNNKEISLGEVSLSVKNNVFINVPNNIDISKIEKRVNLPNKLEVPIRIKDKVGTIDLLYDGSTLASVDIISNNSLNSIDEKILEKREKLKILINNMIKWIKYTGICFLTLILGLLTLIFISRTMNRNRRKKRRILKTQRKY